MERLGDEEAVLVGRAWEMCRHMAMAYRRKCRGPDYEGCIGLRLVESIRRYDGSMDLRRWAINQARYACLDAMREHGGAANGTRVHARPRLVSAPMRHEGADVGALLARPDPAPEWEHLEAYESIARHVVGKTRRVLDALYLDGLDHREAAEALGCDRVDIANLHGYAMRRLRPIRAELVA